jgi:predicted MPP superfamily phosphohydrolase
VYRLTDRQKGRFNLICSGHTHGGQIFLLRPFIHLFDPAVDKRYIKGFFPIKKAMMIVSSGVGTSVVPIRLGVVPEVVVIRLKKGTE